MILPIVPFGSDVLRKECIEIDKSYENLDSLIDNMFETMYAASGVGLAAPQINKSFRLFIIDTEPFEDEENTDHVGIKKVFINPKILLKSLLTAIFKMSVNPNVKLTPFKIITFPVGSVHSRAVECQGCLKSLTKVVRVSRGGGSLLF